MVGILVVDDDPDLVDLISYALQRAGYKASGAFSAAEAVRALALDPPELIILDVNLTDSSGEIVLEYVRRHLRIPVLVLSALREEREIVRVLDAGADDYMAKPFRPRELIARVRTLLRRSPRAQAGDWENAGQPLLVLGPLSIGLERSAVEFWGQPLHLTPTELKLLYFFALNHEQVMSVDSIIAYVWGHDYASESASDVVRVNVARLRRKLAQVPRGGELVQTVPSVGYVLRVPPANGPLRELQAGSR